MKNKNIFIAGTLLTAFSVMLGAFGAHGLRQLVSPEQIEVFKTGVQYQFYHAFALILTGIISQFYDSSLLKWAARLFLVGILFFSGSLYAFTGFEVLKTEGGKWLGPITPLGGLCFIAGWICLTMVFIKKEK
jgi:uncharacterized membrane protein YgdD (TMEM256/DUF423 family)